MIIAYWFSQMDSLWSWSILLDHTRSIQSYLRLCHLQYCNVFLSCLTFVVVYYSLYIRNNNTQCTTILTDVHTQLDCILWVRCFLIFLYFIFLILSYSFEHSKTSHNSWILLCFSYSFSLPFSVFLYLISEYIKEIPHCATQTTSLGDTRTLLRRIEKFKLLRMRTRRAWESILSWQKGRYPED